MLKAEGALGWGVDRTHQRQSEWDPPSSPLLTPREVQAFPGVLCPVLLLPGPETFCVVGMLRALGPPVQLSGNQPLPPPWCVARGITVPSAWVPLAKPEAGLIVQLPNQLSCWRAPPSSGAVLCWGGGWGGGGSRPVRNSAACVCPIPVSGFQTAWVQSPCRPHPALLHSQLTLCVPRFEIRILA